jgi:predicted O-methyltransferase YrrM
MRMRKQRKETDGNMIVDERMSAFIDSLDGGNTPFLNEIEREARETNVPIIRTQMQRLIRFLLTLQKPQSILEVGCAIGFSALLMSEYAPRGCRITTIEKYEKRIPIARENFRRAGKEESITLLEGDAMDILKTLDGPYDFLFMDAAKGQYIHFLPELIRLLPKGGILLSDNVLQDGDIIESRFAVTRRNRTIHSRMREYLYEITHHPQLETVVLPVGDGVTISVKKQEKA